MPNLDLEEDDYNCSECGIGVCHMREIARRLASENRKVEEDRIICKECRNSGDIAATPAPPERKGFVCSLKRATTPLNTRKDRGHGVDAGFRGSCCIVQIPSPVDRRSDWTSRLAFVGSFFRPTLSIRVGPRKLEAQPSDEMIKANF